MFAVACLVSSFPVSSSVAAACELLVAPTLTALYPRNRLLLRHVVVLVVLVHVEPLKVALRVRRFLFVAAAISLRPAWAFQGHHLRFLSPCFQALAHGPIGGQGEAHREKQDEHKIGKDLIRKAPEDRAEYGERFQHYHGIIIDHRSVFQRVSFGQVEHVVSYPPSKYGYVRQRNRDLSGSAQHKNVDRDENSATANPTAARDDQAQGDAKKRQGGEGVVF